MRKFLNQKPNKNKPSSFAKPPHFSFFLICNIIFSKFGSEKSKMKKKIFLPCALLMILTISFPNKMLANSYFDSYLGNISWNKEKAHLAALARELKFDSDLIGYIGFQIGSKEKRPKINVRIAQMKKFLVSTYGLNFNRIIFVISKYPSNGKETFIILQPLSKNIPQPTF